MKFAAAILLLFSFLFASRAGDMTPEHVQELLIFNKLEFVISPWYNLDALAAVIGW